MISCPPAIGVDPVASRFEELFDDGHAAYRAGRYREAVLHFAQAKEAARLARDTAGIFQAGVWEALSWRNVGDNKRAYALLFTLLAEADDRAPVYERWLAEKNSYRLWLGLGRRTREERLARLERLEAFATCHPKVPTGDLPEIRASLEESGAHWAEALSHWEIAWTRDDDTGYIKCGKAFGALESLLRLDRGEEAARWLVLLGETEQDRAGGRLRYGQAQALCGLYAPLDTRALDAARHALEDALTGTDYDGNAAARHLLARLWLLLRPDQDPTDPLHPARAALRRRPETGRDWDRAITLVDYRLAGLRFLAGIPPCDDYYHRHPSRADTHPYKSISYNSPLLSYSIYNRLKSLISKKFICARPSHPSPIPARIQALDPAAWDRRLRRFHAALADADRRAAAWDEDHETDWYSSEVAARRERLEHILAAMGRPPSG